MGAIFTKHSQKCVTTWPFNSFKLIQQMIWNYHETFHILNTNKVAPYAALMEKWEFKTIL